MPIELRHRIVATNGVRLHAVEAGPPEGRLLILLHGFPELWYGWHRHIEAFAAAGYRVLVPDQRGYNLSEKPRGVASYRLDRLAADVVGLIDDAGRERACLAGHDWGGAVAWWVGVNFPRRLDRLALLNVPHPYVMRRHLLHDRAQRRRSWYIFFFQLPWLPELYLRRNNWTEAARALTVTSRPGTCSTTARSAAGAGTSSSFSCLGCPSSTCAETIGPKPPVPSPSPAVPAPSPRPRAAPQELVHLLLSAALAARALPAQKQLDRSRPCPHRHQPSRHLL